MTEGERIIKLETQMNNIEKKVDDVLAKLDDLDKKFASKWVEKVMIVGGTTVGITLIGSVLALILK